MNSIHRISSAGTVLLLLVISACGGGGGGGGGGAADTTAPQASQVTPAAGASGVARTAALTAQFNESILTSSVTDASFTLTRDNAAMAASVSFNGATNMATLTPTAPLALLSTYTASLSSEIADLAGNRLSPMSWQFTTGDGAWGNPELVEIHNVGDALWPQVALDPNGNALAVWSQHDGTRYSIWANHFTPNAGWGTAQLIEINNAGPAELPQIVLDPNGNALAVWRQSDGTRFNVWANRFTPNNGWGTAELIETDNAGDASSPQIAVDLNGNALAVWYHWDGTRHNIWSNRFTPNSGWGTAQMIETDNAGHASSPQVALDPNGNALAVWQQSDGTRYSVWANRFTPSAGWGTAQLVETDNAGSAELPQIALDPNGNALAVWSQWDGTRSNVWANRFTPSGGWGAAELIETDDAGSTASPQIALDPNGNALAVWSQFNGTRDNIWANRFTTSGGWGTAQLIETDNVGDAFDPQIAVDPNGNALAVWEQSDGTRHNIWANRFTPSGGWGMPQLIETDNAGRADSPQISLDPNGNAFAVWRQSDGARTNIFANRFE